MGETPMEQPMSDTSESRELVELASMLDGFADLSEAGVLTEITGKRVMHETMRRAAAALRTKAKGGEG